MLFGARVTRVEDSPLVTGRGTFVHDIEPVGTLHLAVVRSPGAHGEVTWIDLGDLETPLAVNRVVERAVHEDLSDSEVV
jgi:aerobic carbon-monoxide dehydrogenase large subunit